MVICRRCTSNPATIAPGSSPSTNGTLVTGPASRPPDAIPSLTVGPPSSNDSGGAGATAHAFNPSRSTPRTDHCRRLSRNATNHGPAHVISARVSRSRPACPSPRERSRHPRVVAWLELSDSSSADVCAHARQRRCFPPGPSNPVARVSLFVAGECEAPPRLLHRRSEQARSHLAYKRAVSRVAATSGHRPVAWPGEAVISSLTAHALLQIVQRGSGG